MKKKILLILFLIVSFLFLGEVNAISCDYKIKLKACGYRKAFTDGNECFRWAGVFNGGRATGKWYGDLSTVGYVEFPSDTTYATFEKKESIQLTYDTNDENTETKSCRILNWATPLDGSDTSGVAYTLSESRETCPNYLVFNTAIDHTWGGHCDAWVSKSLDNAKSIGSNVISRYNNRSFTHILELTETSEEGEGTNNNTTSCLDFTSKNSCTNNKDFSCMWVNKKIGGRTYEYCNFDDLTYVKCGDIWDIPSRLPGLISFLINLLKIATPIILILVSVISLVKATASSREEDIKKAQNSLIRKLIAAAIVFFIIQITQFVIFKVAESSEKENISSCFSCMINNDCSKNIYYKTKVGHNYQCTSLTGSFNGECH